MPLPAVPAPAAHTRHAFHVMRQSLFGLRLLAVEAR